MTDDFAIDKQRDEMWMRQTLQYAENALSLGEVPVAAIAVLDNELVGVGWNQPISSNDPTAHAEICALRDAARKLENYRLPDLELYVTIEPCTMCLGAIIHARVSRVIYGAKEPRAGMLDSHANIISSDIYNHSFEWTSGVLEKECSELIRDFFREKRKK